MTLSTACGAGGVQAAAEGELKGILGFEERPLVSMDYVNDARSSIVDALSTQVRPAAAQMPTSFSLVIAWCPLHPGGPSCRADAGQPLNSDCMAGPHAQHACESTNHSSHACATTRLNPVHRAKRRE
jgi:hypothetical protein